MRNMLPTTTLIDVVGDTTPPVDVEHLVADIASGSAAAFSELHSLYRDRLHSQFHYYSGDYHLSEDLVQEVFMRAFEEIQNGRFDPRGEKELYWWLIRVGRNKLTNLRTSETRRKKREEFYQELHLGSGRAASNAKRLLGDVYSECTQQQIEVVEMRFTDGRSFVDIEGELGISDTTAWRLVQDFEQKLYTALREQDYGGE